MYLAKAVYPITGNRDSKIRVPKVIQFSGYNANPFVNPGQLTGMENCSSRNFPCISTRAPRTQHTTITTPKAMYATNNGKLCWVDGTSFYYDGVSKGTVTAGIKSIVDFNGTILIFPDKKYYTYGTNTFGTLGNGGTYPATGSVPDMDYICIHNNRVFGCKGCKIYGSQLGNHANWIPEVDNDLMGYYAFTNDEGDFVGITSYGGHVVLFKNDFIHELYGEVPSNMIVKKSAKKGCIDGQSICEINGLLYFLSRDGFNYYNGGIPRLMSNELHETYVSAVCGTNGNTYFACLWNGTKHVLYAFDTFYGVWHKEDELQVIAFTTIGGQLYAMTSETTPQILKFNYGTTEEVSGYVETETFDESDLNKKYYSKLKVKVELGTGASIDIYIKTDNGSYSLIKSFSTPSLQVISVDFTPKRCNNFKVKFVFTGDVKIYGMEREFDTATDI